MCSCCAVSKPKPPPPPPKPVDWAEAPLIELKFAVAQRKVTSARSVAANIDPFGALAYLFFLAAFGFYAYARIGHTVNGHRRAGIVFYEVLVLVAEALVFLSSALYGLCRVSGTVAAACPCICILLCIFAGGARHPTSLDACQQLPCLWPKLPSYSIK